MRPEDQALGLRHGTAVVVEYDPRWASEFDSEEAILRSAIGDSVDAIEHVGSTAVPGLVAKPVLDIAVALQDRSQLDHVRIALGEVGYEYRSDQGDEGGHIFAKGPESARTHYLHLVAAESEQWRSYLVFRDALRRHPELRARYAALKEALAARFPLDRPSYVSGKAEFIEETIGLYRDRLADTEADRRAADGVAHQPWKQGLIEIEAWAYAKADHTTKDLRLGACSGSWRSGRTLATGGRSVPPG